MAEHELSKKGHANETLITVRVGEYKKKFQISFLRFDVHRSLFKHFCFCTLVVCIQTFTQMS
jgi:hypothetical protein